MENNNINSSNPQPSGRINDMVDNVTISFRDLIEIVLEKWYWFVISLVLCIGAGIFLLRREVPQYQRTAVVLVKQDNKNENNLIQFTALGTMNPKMGVDNELYMFRTRMVLTPVVKKQHNNKILLIFFIL